MGYQHLTYHTPNEHGGPDRPVLKIEITPAMIEAGVAKLCGFNRDNEALEDFVPRLLEAALEAAGYITVDRY